MIALKTLSRFTGQRFKGCRTPEHPFAPASPHPYHTEWGSDPDPHRANSKEEDPTGLLNEGFRYRDLETGTFLTRDPLGFVDGPNVYAYVRQNPWTFFDPLGLHVWIEESNPVEPAGHLSIAIGDPVSGDYKSYSFGVNPKNAFSAKNGLQGTVYEDTSKGGKIQADNFIYTNPELDQHMQQHMDQFVEEQSSESYPYRLGNQSCRDWTCDQFESARQQILENELGVEGAPPVEKATDPKAKQTKANPMSKVRPSTQSSGNPSTNSTQPSTAKNPVSSSSTGTSAVGSRGTTVVAGGANPIAAGVSAAGGVSSTTSSGTGTSGEDETDGN